MSIAEEVGGLAELIAARFSGAAIHRFQGPAVPAAGDFVIEFRQETRRSDSRTHTFAERQFSIAYHAEQAEGAVLTLEALSRYLMNERPEAGDAGSSALGAIRADSFTIASPEKLENGLFKCTGSVLVHTREAVVLPLYEKINKVEIRTTIN